MELENRYFTELARRLGSDGVKTSATDGNRLEVLLRSRPVLCVSKNGNVIMLPDGRDNPEAGDLYHQTDALAGEVYEYVHAVENAPLLHAVDLRDKFHLLADFGGAVLAGRRREDGHGYQFVTWIWGYDRTGVNHGHYYEDDFQGAKQDFAVRSGLISKAQLFTPEQLTELYRASEYLLDDGPAPNDQQPKALQEARTKIEYTVPNLAERLEQSQGQEPQMNL